MIKIYGSPRSSAGRCYVMLEECGLQYETIPLDMSKKEHKSEEYLKINPNGKVPTLIDGHYVIWESAAINYYLAQKYKPELLGSTPEEKGHVEQWNIWSMVEFQPPMVDLLIQMVFVPEPRRDTAVIEKSKVRIPEKLALLDQALEGKEYITGSQFLLSDLNLASVAQIGLSLGFDYKSFPHLTKWLEKVKARPSFQKVAAKG